MPEYFWEWYTNKGYDKILDKELCFKYKAFLTGCCIEYLTEKGQRINNLHCYTNIKDILSYLEKGVVWTN